MRYTLFMGKLYVVRHGEIDFNIEERYAGSVDVELNNKGLRQAYGVAKKVSKLNIDLIITSPFKRCTRMADIIHKIINVPIIKMVEFRERNVGVFEGLTQEEAKNKYPKLWVKNITRVYNNAPTGGETIKEVENRVFSGLKKIKKKYKNKNILIITHGFASKVINKFFNTDITEEDFFKYKLNNANIKEYGLIK